MTQQSDDLTRPELDITLDPLGAPVSREALVGRLDSFLLNRMNPSRQEFTVREVTPRLTWNRLDLAVKLYFLKQSETVHSAFAEELYDAHIHAFSLGDFREPGNSAKTDPASFRSAFREIAQSVRTEGFDPEKSLMPLASDGSFINGGHRAACALFLHRDVHAVETGLPPVRYDYRFFRNRGLDDDLLEAAIVKYMELNPRSRLAVIWPGAGFESRVEALLGPLVYRKELRLTAKGSVNLLDHLAFELPDRHVKSSRSGHLLRPVVLVFDMQGRQDLRSLDASLRQGQGPGCAHVLGSHRESLDVARLLLNERSVLFLNAASPKRFPKTSRLAADFRAALENSGISTERTVLGAGMLLATLGAREAMAADFMSPVRVAEMPDLVQQPCGAHITEILEDPRRHLHYGGLKFLSVPEAIATARGRQSLEASEELSLLMSIRSQTTARTAGRMLVYKARLYHSRLRRSTIHAVARLGLREQAKAAYRALRRAG